MNLNLICSAVFKKINNASSKPEIPFMGRMLFLLSFVFFYTGSQAQTISLNKKRMPAVKVITAIQEQSGYNLFYASALLDNGKKTDVTLEKANFTEAMEVAVSNQPYVYELIGKTIVLKNRLVNKSKTGQSLKGNGEKEEMINNGYQKTTKKSSTGSTSQVSREEIEQNSTQSVLDLLSTKSGVHVQGNSITIRGASSIMLSNDPLVLVDGVSFPASSLNSLNTSSIENITVLKDAGETAIYGVRGANGVIVIATRQGGKKDSVNELGSVKENGDGSVLFNRAHILSVMKVISQWYKIGVTYDSLTPEGNYSGRLNPDITYDEMIQILQSAGIVFKQVGRDIVVSG